MQDLRSKAGWLLIPAALILGLFFFLFADRNEPAAIPETAFNLTELEPSQPEETAPPIETIPETLMIDIKGHVAKPGVYELPAGSRMKDAIDAAGGLLENAESRAINLAMKLQDETAVYVPETGEEAAADSAPAVVVSSPAEESAAGLVNINTASASELETLPGIGPSKAAAIISHREEHGDFQSAEALTEVTGIGDKTFEALKDAITAN